MDAGVRGAAAYSIIIIYQVQVLCCEIARGVYVTIRETTTVITQQQQRQQHYVCI